MVYCTFVSFWFPTDVSAILGKIIFTLFSKFQIFLFFWNFQRRRWSFFYHWVYASDHRGEIKTKHKHTHTQNTTRQIYQSEDKNVLALSGNWVSFCLRMPSGLCLKDFKFSRAVSSKEWFLNLIVLWIRRDSKWKLTNISRQCIHRKSSDREEQLDCLGLSICLRWKRYDETLPCRDTVWWVDDARLRKLGCFDPLRRG